MSNIDPTLLADTSAEVHYVNVDAQLLLFYMYRAMFLPVQLQRLLVDLHYIASANWSVSYNLVAKM